MDYHLTTLGADRFQNLCQAILSKKYSRVQCFPTGQPDGGRDASLKARMDLSDVVVYQVKFSKNPGLKTEREAVESLIRLEKAKVLDLIERGATEYVLMTNIKGTAHKESGSIDRVNKMLTEAFSIPVFCYWQDEIERELDGSSDLKWSYPEAIKATDLLEVLVLQSANGIGYSQKSAIKSFLASQADDDQKLKFKQIEIQENIVKLFVDVPAEISIESADPKGDASLYHKSSIKRILAESNVIQTLSEQNKEFDEGSPPVASAYQILTNKLFFAGAKRVVVEGAPGQGKSTITQFICQVHRLKFLGRHHELSQIQSVYRPSDISLPIRVDLRDYSTWLSGYNPFSVSEGERPKDSSDALESFLAWMIAQTTGCNFSADDLNAFFRNSRLLIVLDGFDEVAETEVREIIVRQVSAAAVRLDVLCIDFQIIVTSRPAAFANSPGFPRSEWAYVQLQSLTKGVINQYANQWLGGGIKDEKDKLQILDVLNEKLTQPHIRDLARNPMQLAILLSLISVQGASLPDQRTSLYDKYIDIFFNRESEKSTTVRDNRATLIEIHQFLAWKLHSESEVKGEKKTLAGSISKDALVREITNFLEVRGHDKDIVNQLFTGLVERVVALVSRTEGTFEFEVQPLREYFAARWLFETAPYAPPGVEVAGTLTDRFDAIARNFYWQNVTRFMAGCYSAGQLASLEDCIRNLTSDNDFHSISYPATLGMTLLNDYVFEQHPRIAQRLISELIQTQSFERLLKKEAHYRGNQMLAIPRKSGREILLSHLKSEILVPNHDATYFFVLARHLRFLFEADEGMIFWNECRASFTDQDQWLRLGSIFGVFDELPIGKLEKLREELGESVSINAMHADRFDFLWSNEEAWQETVKNHLSTGYGFMPQFSLKGRRHVNLEALTIQEGTWRAFGKIDALRFLNVDGIEDGNQIRVGELLQSYGISSENCDFSTLRSSEEKLVELIELLDGILNISLGMLYSGSLHFDEILQVAGEVWGLNWMIFERALTFSRNIDPNYRSDQTDFNPRRLVSFIVNLKSESKSLVEWNSLIEGARSFDWSARRFVLVAVIQWAPDNIVFSKNCTLMSEIDELSESEWQDIIASRIRRISPNGQDGGGNFPNDILICAEPFTERVFSIFLNRFEVSQVEGKLVEWFELTGINCNKAMEILTEYCFEISLVNGRGWDRTLQMAQACNDRGISPHFIGVRESVHKMPLPLAKYVLGNQSHFPFSVIGMAEQVVTSHIGLVTTPIAEIALSRKWFGSAGLPDC